MCYRQRRLPGYAAKINRIVHSLHLPSLTWVILVLHTAVDHADAQQRPSHHIVVCGVQVLVQLRQAALDVPQVDHTHGGCGAGLAMVLVFEDPVHCVIDKGIAVLGQQVGGIHQP